MILACIIAWGLVFASTVPAAFRIVLGRGEGQDPVKWSFFLFSVVFLGFNVRWFMAPENATLLLIMRSLSILLAGYVLSLVWFYRK